MRSVQVRDAKAGLSALIDAAEQGEPTTITRHGVPAAAIVPIEDVLKLYPEKTRSFEDFVLSFPGGIEFERDHTPMRDIDL
jgi:prevent-host-death family protein